MTDDFDLFSGPAPSVISETSALAASKVTDPMRARSYRLIIEALANRGGAMTREALMLFTGKKESSLCARLWELRPTWIKTNPGAGVSGAGLRVDTYELTPAALERWKKAVTA